MTAETILAADEPRIDLFDGPRQELRTLFEEAEDSAAQLDGYIKEGRVLVARVGTEIAGHLQVVDTGRPGEAELKNMAVHPRYQRLGIGRALIDALVNLLAAERVTTLLVATATAGIDNLRFYQRCGFRLRSIERDAFTAATGYPPGILIDGIELRDRVWLDRELPTL
ncbi:GNAT family N-acetyltransferase [Frankia sp. AgKG'84/4]|uniref:GNAT family N-acetyltransferase n=1 Tax=Frankia sp. AgKG'84/4 TaxID=573490 RepID=UPI00200DC74E|nr:GNAT family N-acetyltransferase [Frankia sp. AgKG'84/4]MCL9794271.1 GNAT family N-acetyltransferase [Frankia sp. AgKG'84/4]